MGSVDNVKENIIKKRGANSNKKDDFDSQRGVFFVGNDSEIALCGGIMLSQYRNCI